ncbi:transglycosylase SLT domain-containing protein [Microbulbifer thermotolerans]|uniref:Transglycosylase SLT domain-containing protein n=1 Tax=Microbulbifer thermotolerans TaxID=252514 RepID=A0AB35HW73_MICTH|nr:transglycosylase SLT domain-containing protein [Microbulbifer thermotolerans]MCX2782170.1 transglycosylase SLT domain-containing protein [Microbulbifer thermotolerans]MCX2801176.1 transglycosylase SLT domain-containing protein [Microbulbifer thermotolerans]MCX2831325.1 transglycosylase SLT domain-containing protein [Microbulbifer thermotolerans]MCX2835251.1 transglycosylase SLT domain-containing protein [Microbulbifer thermotolerans]MCX2841367.1 transglycosylase SLT domain-containing protei
MGKNNNKRTSLLVLTFHALLAAGCATSPPSNPDDICSIFREKKSWYREAKEAEEKWNSPVPTMMAILYQESRFVHDARPPRTKILGFIPGPRPSDAYGYPQALNSTWRTYQRATFNYGADRDDFGDAIDFVGWYNNTSARQCSIRPDDTYHLYLAYHEGHGGFNRRTFRNKGWLKSVSHKVSARAQTYRRQLASCESSLKRRRKFLGLF